MNLLLYFCVPLVVTGQILVARSEQHGGSEGESIKRVENPETSETEMYSKYEYGSDIGYKNAPTDEYAAGQHGEHFRRPLYPEDTGEVGKPSIYHTVNGNNDHPSFIASNIYTSLRDKKNGRGTKSNRLPSPLAYGVPPEEQAAALSASHHHGHNLHSEHARAPLVPITSHHHQHVLVQEPHSGHLVQTPVYQNGLVPLYQSHVAPHVAYYGSGGAAAQKVFPAFKTAAGVPLYQQQLVGKAVSPVYQQDVLLNAAYAPAYYQTPLLKTGIAPSPAFLQKGHGENVFITGLFKPDISHNYQPQLLKSHNSPVYQTHVFKSPDALVYQKPVLKVHPTPVLKTEPVAVYPGLHHQAGPLYQLPLLKGGGVPLAHFKSPVDALHHTPYLTTPVQFHPQAAVLLEDAAKPYQHAILQPNILNTGPLLKTPILKTHNLEATIVPAIAEQELHHSVPVLKSHLKQPHLAHYLDHGAELLGPGHPKVLIQKTVLHKPPVLTGKAVLKAALSPVYSNPGVNIQKAIYKAPLHSHFVDNGAHYGPISPAAIFSSHKAVVNSLISSDTGKYGAKAAAHLELVPSLSYGYSYSLYPKASGVYGPPLHDHDHHHHHHK